MYQVALSRIDAKLAAIMLTSARIEDEIERFGEPTMKALLPASIFVLMMSIGMSLHWRELVANCEG